MKRLLPLVAAIPVVLVSVWVELVQLLTTSARRSHVLYDYQTEVQEHWMRGPTDPISAIIYVVAVPLCLTLLIRFMRHTRYVERAHSPDHPSWRAAAAWGVAISVWCGTGSALIRAAMSATVGELSPFHEVRITVFVISVGIASSYYWLNASRFPSPADKVTYFTGACLGPVGVVQALI